MNQFRLFFKITVFAFLLFFVLSASAQNFEWVKVFRGNNEATSIGGGVKVDASGNVYSLGVHRSGIDLDPSDLPGDTFILRQSLNTIKPQGYIAKLDKSGKLIWGKAIAGRLKGGKAASYGQLNQNAELYPDFCLDNKGNIYITSSFIDYIDLDPGPDTIGFDPAISVDSFYENQAWFPTDPPDWQWVRRYVWARNFFVVKLDSNGIFQWARQFGKETIYANAYPRVKSIVSVKPSDITTDATGNVYIGGTFEDTADFDPSIGISELVPKGEKFKSDAFILKLNADGEFLWVNRMGGIGDDAVNKIAVDNDGFVYASGNCSDSADFGPFMFYDRPENFICKLNPTGEFLWVKMTENSCYDLKIGPQNNIYASGSFSSSTVDFDPGPGTFNLDAGSSVSSAYAMKLSGDGNFIWATKLIDDRFAYSSGHVIGVDVYGNAYVSGLFGLPFGTQADFHPGESPTDTFYLSGRATRDLFLSKLDASGNFVWAGSMGVGGLSSGICIDGSNNIFMAGRLELVDSAKPIDADMGRGISDTFSLYMPYGSGMIHKMSYACSEVYGAYIDTACESLTYNNKIYTVTGVYTDTFTNSVGCDSFVRLDLTIHPKSSTEVTATGCYSYMLNGETYTQSGTYTQMLKNVAGCDSILTLNITVLTVDASVTQNGRMLTANAPGRTYQWVDCENGYMPLTGATSQSFTSNIDGSYAVIVSEEGCSDTSDCFEVGGTHIFNPNYRQNIWVYPNPTNGQLIFLIQDYSKSITVRLINMLGKTLETYEGLGNNKLVLDLSGYPSGIYIVEAAEADGEVVERIKVVKE